MSWSVDKWQTVSFSDESTFTVQNHRGNNHARRKPGEEFKTECILPTFKYPASVMVWGCFAAAGPGRLHLHFVDGMTNAQNYCEVLKNVMLPFSRSLFSDE